MVPESILQLLCLKIKVLVFKRVGSKPSLDLWLKAMHELSFIYDNFLSFYVPPLVKDTPESQNTFPFMVKLEDFLRSQQRLLLVAAKSGMGKTSCALHLCRKPQRQEWKGESGWWTWLFISLPSVHEPFSRLALVRHIRANLSLGEHAADLGGLKSQCRLVLVLDSLDEVAVPGTAPEDTWWDLNEFSQWSHVKLIVTCREEHTMNYGRCMGDSPDNVLYIQPFQEQQVEEYVSKRLGAVDDEADLQQGPAHTGRCLPVVPISLVKTSLQADKQSQVAERQANKDRMLAYVKAFPDRQTFCTPFKLNMAVDLMKADVLMEGITRESQLYLQWLKQTFRDRLPQDAKREQTVEQDVCEALALAWDLHCQGIAHDKVGARAEDKEGFFRRCPLRVHDYRSDATFSFQHKSLQEYLVAAYLYQKLTVGAAETELSSINLFNDLPVLRFFGDIHMGSHPPPLLSTLLLPPIHPVL